MTHTLRRTAELARHNLINGHDRAHIAELARHYAIGVPAVLLDRLPGTPGLARQFVPDAREMDVRDYELADPIADDPYSPVPGLVHRYRDRVLLKAVAVCPVYCRFCFRREKVGPHGEQITKAQLDDALAYIAQTPQIREVILSGGDPLMLSPARLAAIRDRLDTMPHIGLLRAHTRVPLMTPAKITDDLLAAFQGCQQPHIVLHANHPDEFTKDGIAAINRIINAGIPMRSQSVLLKGVNDDEGTLAELMRTFVRHRITPYYLHQLDPAPGTAHFHVDIARGRELMRYLRANYPDLLLPAYVQDQPDGSGKMRLEAM